MGVASQWLTCSCGYCSGKKKRVPDNYEKSEGELDQDSEDEKSEGELEDDDKEEVWEERTDYRVEKDRSVLFS